jgi:CheY-like chemotaxis protein
MDQPHDEALADCERQLEELRERESMLRRFFDDVDIMRGIIEITDEKILHGFVNQAAADPNKSDTPKDPALHGNETILVVEDEEFVREPLARILRSRGYSVLEASNSKEAQRQVQEYAGEIHLVLSDVVLPDQNGRAMSLQIAKMRPDIKILFISGYPENAIVRHGVLDGNIAFLPKPFGGDALARKVREVLDA